MTDNQSTDPSVADAELEHEIRMGRKFTLEEAIGRLAGPGAMKGQSPVPRMQQAEIEIGSWLRTHTIDAAGAFEVVLHRQVKSSELLLKNYEQPLVVLAGYCQQLLESDYSLKELVRECDVEWGRIMGERPYFETQGAAPNADDPYTVDSVRTRLLTIVQQLALVAG
jgi:hypothetical protein